MFKLAGKIDLRGSRGPWSSILLFAAGVNEKCKIATEAEETIGFFVTFLSLVKFQLQKTKKVFTNFPRGFWRFPTKFQRFKK